MLQEAKKRQDSQLTTQEHIVMPAAANADVMSAIMPDTTNTS